jgi:hypothetical protein
MLLKRLTFVRCQAVIACPLRATHTASGRAVFALTTKERRTMKILELEERYRRLQDEFVEAARRISRIAADQETSPARVRAARERADELKRLTHRARIDLALALSAEGIPAVQIAGRIGTTLASVNDMLALGGDSVIED